MYINKNKNSYRINIMYQTKFHKIDVSLKMMTIEKGLLKSHFFMKN